MRKPALAAILGASFAFPALAADWLSLPNDQSYWQKAGYAKMVGPLHLPTNAEQTDVIQVWLKLPEGAKVSAQRIFDSRESRFTLVYPAGTIASRVEFQSDGASVGDVRGARIDQDGKTIFHVYEPSPLASPGEIVGYEWPRQDDAADAAAGQRLAHLYFPRGDEPRLPGFLKHNRCLGCHQENAPSPAVITSPLQYQSDSRGFLQTPSVLSDEITVRNHREWDLNADDRFVTVTCSGQPVKAVTRAGMRGYACPNGVAPMGRLDVAAALAAGEQHAKDLCASRRYLFDHMDDGARAAFAPAFTECGIR